MPEAAPAPVVAEPTKIPPPIAAGPNGSAALAEGDPKPVTENPFEFELDIKGQKQKLSFASKDQLKAVLQKALYADQVIKDATQAKKGAETMMHRLKAIGQGDTQAFREMMGDPDIGGDVKKVALKIVQEMMDDEKLTPEQRDLRELKKYREDNEALKKSQEDSEKQRVENERRQRDAQVLRTEIIDSMRKYPDIPQTQATMDAVIQNMRAAYKRFGKHLSPEQAMTVYSQQYWTSLGSVLDKMTPEQILSRFGPKTLDRIQQSKLNQLKDKTNPSRAKVNDDAPVKKKKNMTEKEFEKHLSQQLAGL